MRREDTLEYRTLEMLTLFATSAGHLAQRAPNEHRGNCLPPGHCTPVCQAWVRLMGEWADRLDTLDNEQPAQLELLEVAG